MREGLNSKPDYCEDWIDECLEKVRDIATQAVDLNEINSIILRQDCIHEGIEIARVVWTNHGDKADMDVKKTFLRMFFGDYFRKSAAPDSASRHQWHVLLKEHAIFVAALCAEYFRNFNEGFAAPE